MHPPRGVADRQRGWCISIFRKVSVFCLLIRIFSVVLYSTALSVVYCLLQVLCNRRMALFFSSVNICSFSLSFLAVSQCVFSFSLFFHFLTVFLVSHCVFSFYVLLILSVYFGIILSSLNIWRFFTVFLVSNCVFSFSLCF